MRIRNQDSRQDVLEVLTGRLPAPRQSLLVSFSITCTPRLPSQKGLHSVAVVVTEAAWHCSQQHDLPKEHLDRMNEDLQRIE